ncbi:unnamed protein product [Cylindrotheca closterium]|uniref:Protein kinase domain-containing protein n=1 Tax=Cylindrotheca closterium TaxID=2856 RepID=A0AAD2JHP6_9STRA|nr:unnamed protein product [Cylindrotheca closterium]
MMTAPVQDKEKVRKAGAAFASKEIDKMFAKSKIVDSSDTFPQFLKEEIKLGKVLGKGGFGTVYECLSFDAKTKSRKQGGGLTTMSAVRNSFSLGAKQVVDEEADQGQMESRKFIADHCIRKGGDARYALKILSPEVVNDPGELIQGSIDMAVETRVLSDIEHPNIIKMRACGSISPFEVDYFIVMDRLYDTLESRIAKWANLQSRISSGFGACLLDRKGLKKKKLLEDKLVSAFDLSAAILYLHKKNILYRDLKPENVGFDIRDDIKLFDFGLAKEVFAADKDADGLYKLTAMTGSPRYMAPEVALEKPYSFSCDAYSFAIMFHQIYSCRTPFELYGMKSLRTRVWGKEQKRPYIQPDWPVSIKNLLEKSWSANVHDRLTFQEIYNILREECVGARDGVEEGLEHSKRRSTFVFTGPSTKKTSSKGAKPIMEALQEFDYDDDEEEGDEERGSA